MTGSARWRRWLARQVPAATRSKQAAESLAASQWLTADELAALQSTLRERHDRAGRRRPLVGRTISSSGSGGSPKRARWSVDAMRWQDAADARSRSWAGLEQGASRVWVCCNPADRVRRLGSLVQNTRIVSAAGVADDETVLGALADRLERQPPDAVQGVSNVLAALARELARRGVTLPGTTCISAGNHLTPWYRRQLEAVFARPARERYAVSEVGLIAASCDHGALHVNVETLLVEVVDADGDAVPPGAVGAIVVTMLHNGPATRLAVGDVGRLLEEPCACGRGLPTIELLGRASEQLRLADDRLLSPSELFGALDDETIADARFRHRTDSGVLDVEIVRASPEVRDAERLARLVGPGVRVAVRDVARLAPGPSGKLRLVESV